MLSADILLYALVAAGLVFWLKNILGTRHGDEKTRHNPYAGGAAGIPDSVSTDTGAMEDSVQIKTHEIVELSKNPTETLSIESKRAETGLLDIANASRDFEIKKFLEAAQDAFVIIVESFAEGDKDTLKTLLAKPVYDAFAHAIDDRFSAGQSLETEIHAIKKAEVIDAVLDKKTAYITIRFTASETSVERDENGEILSGHPDQVTDMRDIWVFSRQVNSRDPRWLVYETRGDFDGDNETLPNSDGSDD